MEYMDLFMGFLDNTGTLVNFDGIGHLPQVSLVELGEGEQATTALIYARMRDKYLNRWYAWAAQFWLPDKHAEWFRELRNMSHTPDNSIHLTTKLALLDDSSPGVYRFYKIACTGASMPLLEKLTFLKNLSPWWKAPKEQRWREEVRIEPDNVNDKLMNIDIKTQNDRRNTIHEVLDYVKTENMTGVILYTTSIDIVAYCIYKDIDIIIENNWSGCISVKGIRNQIDSQRNLLGSGTIWVNPETKILTFLALMMCSCSHGLTMYAAFGWDNVLAEWYKIVGVEPTIVKEDEADEKCVWLARMQDENILLNAPLFNILFVRLMNKAFTPDKKISKGDNGVGYMKYLSKYYTEMKDEDRIGSGRVKPVITEELVRSDGVADDGGTEEGKAGEPPLSPPGGARPPPRGARPPPRGARPPPRGARPPPRGTSEQAPPPKQTQDSTSPDKWINLTSEPIQKLVEQIMVKFQMASQWEGFTTKRQLGNDRINEIKDTDTVNKLIVAWLGLTISDPDLLVKIFDWVTKNAEVSGKPVEHDLVNFISKLREMKLNLLRKEAKRKRDEDKKKEEQMEKSDQGWLKYGSDVVGGMFGGGDQLFDPSGVRFASRYPGSEWETKEWMFAQRLCFISSYYAPVDLDTLLLLFKDRFKDWTGVAIITINM